MSEFQKNYTIQMAFTTGRIEGVRGDEKFILDSYNPNGDNFTYPWQSEPRIPVVPDYNHMVTQQLQEFPRHIIAKILGESMNKDDERPEYMREVSSEVLKIVSEIIHTIYKICFYKESENDPTLDADLAIQIKTLIRNKLETLKYLLIKIQVRLNSSSIVSSQKALPSGETQH